MKVKLTELAKELEIDFNEALKIKNLKLDRHEVTGTGKNTWLTEEGRRKFEIAVMAENAVPDVVYGKVLHEAPNRKWVYVNPDGQEGKFPALIPKRLIGRLVGKRIPLHVITDANGSTYRHASLTDNY